MKLIKIDNIVAFYIYEPVTINSSQTVQLYLRLAETIYINVSI